MHYCITTPLLGQYARQKHAAYTVLYAVCENKESATALPLWHHH